MQSLSKQPRLDISSMMLASPLLPDVLAACAENGIIPGIQIHNTATPEDIDAAAATKLPLTAHIPLLSEWQINLASHDLTSSVESLETSVAIMRAHGVKSAVLHAFMMTDLPIPSFGRGRSYDEAMAKVLRPELTLPGSRICRDFFGTGEFAERCELTRRNIRTVAGMFPDMTFLIENDFPGYGSGNILSEHAASLDCDLCLDSSHLWAAAAVFERNFLNETDSFLRGGRVRMVHLHASPFKADTPPDKFGDGHLPLTAATTMPLAGFVARCRKAGINHYVIESGNISAEDIRIFRNMWGCMEATA